MKFLLDCFSESDGKTWDVGRIQWFAGTVCFFGLSGWAYIFKGQAFDPVTWGAGLIAVLGSGAGMIWLKGKEAP